MSQMENRRNHGDDGVVGGEQESQAALSALWCGVEHHFFPCCSNTVLLLRCRRGPHFASTFFRPAGCLLLEFMIQYFGAAGESCGR